MSGEEQAVKDCNPKTHPTPIQALPLEFDDPARTLPDPLNPPSSLHFAAQRRSTMSQRYISESPVRTARC